MKKKTVIWIIVTAIILIAVIVSGILLFVNTQRKKEVLNLHSDARNILLSSFQKTDLSGKAPLKRVIDNENPMNLVNYYGDETLENLWKAIPDKQKPYSIVLLIPYHTLKSTGQASLKSLEAWADYCNDNQIPYAIQNINGETHMEGRLPMAYIEDRFASRHAYFYGLNAAELYNGVDWRGELESDNSRYICECVKLCAKYGSFFIWTDTNRNYENGMLLEWLESNETFYSTFKEYSQYICLLNKESIAHPSTYAIMQGLWLAGLVGNWGVASDWWHWQCDCDKKSLFGDYDDLVEDEWEMIFSFPENMYVQSMMLVMSRGGTCFKAEAPNFSTCYNGKPLAGFEYGISPLLNRIIDGEITIPTKQEVFNETEFVVLGKENYSKVNYNFDESNLYPQNGNLGIVPLLPKNLRLQERKAFLDQGIELLEEKLSKKKFLQKFGSNNADTYLTYAGNNWYYINNLENIRGSKFAQFQPRYSNADSVYIAAEEHTSAIITEEENGLDFYLSNYRTDKKNMLTGSPSDISEAGWANYVGRFLSLDENGNPVGVDDSAKRKTVVKVVGTYAGGMPKVSFGLQEGMSNYRPYSYTTAWNADTKELTIEILHNGIVELEVSLDSATKSIENQKRDALTDVKTQNNNDISILEEATKSFISDSHNYTYYSYLNYERAFEACKVAISEKTYSKSEIKSLARALQKAEEKLINVATEVQLLQKVLTKYQNGEISADSEIMLKYDLLLRELLSVQPYVEGRDNDLTYERLYKSSAVNWNLYRKPNHIIKSYNALKDVVEA